MRCPVCVFLECWEGVSPSLCLCMKSGSHIGLLIVFTRNCSHFQRSGTVRDASSPPTMRSIIYHCVVCLSFTTNSAAAHQSVTNCDKLWPVFCPSGLRSAADPGQQPAGGQGGRSHRQRLHPRQRNRHDLHVRGETGTISRCFRSVVLLVLLSQHVLTFSRSGWIPAGSGTLSRVSGCCCRCSGR